MKCCGKQVLASLQSLEALHRLLFASRQDLEAPQRLLLAWLWALELAEPAEIVGF